MEEREKSSTGLDENVAGFFCYLLGCITGIVFLVVEKKSRFVKFHAMQSTITFLDPCSLRHHRLDPDHQSPRHPLWILSLILWLFLMIKALRGERYPLPIVGKMMDEKTDQ